MGFFIIAMIMHKAKLDRDNRLYLPFPDKNNKENENRFFLFVIMSLLKNDMTLFHIKRQ
jgi:hypothetical protein